MSTTVGCPTCNAEMLLPADLPTKEARCPRCGCVFTPAPKSPVAAGDKEHAATPSTAITETAQVGASPSPPQAEEEAERPWDRTYQRRTRRDAEPHRGNIILVLGILGLVVGFLGGLGLPFGVAAWIMGHRDLRKIRYQKSMDPDGEGMTQAGMVCGVLGSIFGLLCGLGTIAYCFFVVYIVSATLANMPANRALMTARMAPMTTVPASVVPAPPPVEPAPVPDDKGKP